MRRKSTTPWVAGQRREALTCRSSSATCQTSPANGSAPVCWAQARSRCRRRSRNSPRVAELYCMPPDSQTACGSASRSEAAPPRRAEQDPHLGGVQRRRGLVTVLQRVEQLDAQQFGQPGQGELVHPEPGPLARPPRPSSSSDRCDAGSVRSSRLSWKRHSPRRAMLFAVAAGDPAVRGPGQRAGPGDESATGSVDPVLAPARSCRKHNPAAVQIALTAGHRARGRGRSGRVAARRRGGVEVRPAQTRAGPGPAAAIAAP